MGELGARHLRSFDPVSAEIYASVSSDNRLRLWNTASGELRQTYVEPQHLSKRYTCMAWHRPNLKSKRSSTGAPKPSTLGMIALGTDKGTITVWDLKRGAVAHSLGEGEGLPEVTSVVFSADGTSLFSASSAREIIEWNLETGAVARKLKGQKKGSTHMCLHPAGKVLAIASASIRLVDLITGKIARKFSGGHAGAVRLLSFSPDGCYLASSASSARFVNVFDVAGEIPSAEPVATLGFAATPTFLALHATVGGEEEDDRITAVAGFDVGGVSVLRTRRRADCKAGGVSKVDISGAGGAASPSALHGCFSHDRPSSAVLLATGSPASPGFTEALFDDDAGALLPSATVGGGVSPKQEREDDEPVGEKGPLAHVVGPGELGIRGKEKDSSADGGEGLRAEDEDGRAAKRLRAGRDGEGDAGMTIAERLEALSQAMDLDAESAVGARKHPGGDEGGEGGVLGLTGRGGERVLQPRTESLSTVLTQALQSGDESLLEECLAVGNQGVIEATVERLASSKVLPFLLRVVGKLEKSPNRSAALGRWIRALLSCHLGYLVSVPGLPEKLALLHQLIDRRVASFPKLLQLHGRLDLLLARAKSGGGGSRRRESGRAMDAPEAVYREEDEEGGEEEDDEGEAQEESEESEAGNEEGEDELDDGSEAEEHDDETDEQNLEDQQEPEELN